MSTDLKFRHGLPEIRLRPAEMQTHRVTDTANKANGTIQSEDHEEDEECRTPTSDEHKIPISQSCPPAPRKPRRVVLCKRKLNSEVQFFEIVGRHEVELFFQSSFQLPCLMSRNVKKRCYPNSE